MPGWKTGNMYLHHLSTGRGNSTYLVFPDGTTMLIDCGDAAFSGAKVHNEVLPQLPDTSRTTGAWVREYIKRFAPKGKAELLDYVLITHYDGDHIGAPGEPDAYRLDSLPYVLSGITELFSYIKVNKFVDRSYPHYPSAAHIRNYESFLHYQTGKNVSKAEAFEVGSVTQFAVSDPLVKVRNVCSNGIVWTGQENKVREVFHSKGENENSCGIMVSYGPFKYLSCGDIPGWSPKPEDMETAVADVVGKCNVVVACHHGYKDSMNPSICEKTDPQAYVIPVREYWHPCGRAVENMCNESIHTSSPQLFCTGLLDSAKENFEKSGYGKYFMPAGHIVVRVFAKGRKYRIYVLNDKVNGNECVFKSPVYNLD